MHSKLEQNAKKERDDPDPYQPQSAASAESAASLHRFQCIVRKLQYINSGILTHIHFHRLLGVSWGH